MTLDSNSQNFASAKESSSQSTHANPHSVENSGLYKNVSLVKRKFTNQRIYLTVGLHCPCNVSLMLLIGV